MAGLQDALKKLIEDPSYAQAVAKDPARLTREYKKLDPQEILSLMQLWLATGDPGAKSMIRLCHCCCGHKPK